MTIIGSREQLCIHAEVSKKETNSEKVRSLVLLVCAEIMCLRMIV